MNIVCINVNGLFHTVGLTKCTHEGNTQGKYLIIHCNINNYSQHRHQALNNKMDTFDIDVYLHLDT